MSTQFDSSLLSGYLDGELDADELALVERVLDEQPERLRELEALRHLQRSVATLPTPRPTVDPVAAVRARIEQSRPLETGSTRRWWLQAAPFALAACLLLAAGWIMFGSNLNPSQLASDRVASPHSEMAAERAAPFHDADAQPEQLSRPASEPRPPMLRSRSEFYAEPRDGALERETASPRAMGGGFGGMAQSTPEADFGIAQPLSGPAGPADTEYSFRPEQNAPSDAMSLEAATEVQPQLNQPSAVRLRYGVPEEEHAETVRWLRTVVPRELKDIPPSGEAKRFWFLGYQHENQNLQAAIKKRLEVTDGELKVVQSASEAISMEADVADPAAGVPRAAKSTESRSTSQSNREKLAEPTRRAGEALRASPRQSSGAMRSKDITALPDDSAESTRLSIPEGEPTAIIIEMFAHPKE